MAKSNTEAIGFEKHIWDAACMLRGNLDAATVSVAAASGGAAFKVIRYYHTDWVPEGSLRLSVDGLNMDAVYAGFVRQSAGEALSSEPGETLQASVARSEARQRLAQQIAALEAKVRKEKQLNRRIDIMRSLESCGRRWEVLRNE